MADFVKHTSCDNCGSSDARALYSDGSWYCWSCEDTKVSEEWKAENAGKPFKPPMQVRSKPREKSLETEVKKSSKPVKPAKPEPSVKPSKTPKPAAPATN